GVLGLEPSGQCRSSTVGRPPACTLPGDARSQDAGPPARASRRRATRPAGPHLQRRRAQRALAGLKPAASPQQPASAALGGLLLVAGLNGFAAVGGLRS